jgi:hypothetical protein
MIELIRPEYLEDWQPEKRQDYKTATLIVEQVSEKNIDLVEEWGGKVMKQWALLFAYFEEQGRHLFKTICSCSQGYIEAEADKAFEEALKSTKIFTSIGKLVKAAKLHNLMTKPPKTVPEGAKRGNDAVNFLPEGVDRRDFEEFNFWEEKNQYFCMNHQMKIVALSNFTMKVLYHVQTSKDSAKRLVEVTNIYGYKKLINIDTDDFVSVGNFKKVLARNGNYLFKGGDAHLANLQDKLQRDEKHTMLIDVLGWHSRAEAYFFANGMWSTKHDRFIEADENGIVQLNDTNYFVPYLSKIYADKDGEYQNEKKFLFITQDDYGFCDWAKDINAVYGKHGWAMMCFYAAAVFSDVVFNKMGSRFPMFHVFGPRGTGKGSFITSMMRLFGEPQSQIMLGGDSTSVGFMRKMAGLKNSVVWLDEYKNNLKPKLIESLKNIYDRTGYTRGQKTMGFETETIPIRSAAVLTGQDLANVEPALFSRLIVVVLPNLDKTEEVRKRFKDFEKREEQGLSFITALLHRMRPLVMEKFTSYHNDEESFLYKRSIDLKDLIPRLPSNYAMVIAMGRFLIEFYNKMPFTIEELREYVLKLMREHYFLMVGSDDVQKFWQVVEQLYMQQKIKEGVDFLLIKEDNMNKLYIRLNNVHSLYKERMRTMGEAFALDEVTLRNYLERDPSKFIGKDKKMFGAIYTTCLVFNYDLLEVTLGALRRVDDEKAEGNDGAGEVFNDTPVY